MLHVLLLLAAAPIIVTAPMAFWTFVSGTVVPILTALVVKVDAPAGFKAVLNAILAGGVATVIYATQHDGSFDLYSALLLIAGNIIASAGFYAGALRKTLVPVIERAAPGGVGPVATPRANLAPGE